MELRKPAAIIVLLLFLTSCSSVFPNANSVGQLELTYITLSDAYSTSMNIIRAQRAQGKVTDEQWSRVEEAQKMIQKFGPQLRDLIDLYRLTSQKPRNIDDIAQQLELVVDNIIEIAVEVSK